MRAKKGATTGHAESVRVTYDPARVTYEQLLEVFLSVAHDPTQLNRQGPAVGTGGWLAIDPKGVVGEVEYEIGASLRNPGERAELFASPNIVERRIGLYEARLRIDAERALGWAHAQAVLSVVWSVEDGFPVDPAHPALQLARAIESLLG